MIIIQCFSSDLMIMLSFSFYHIVWYAHHKPYLLNLICTIPTDFNAIYNIIAEHFGLAVTQVIFLIHSSETMRSISLYNMRTCLKGACEICLKMYMPY